MALMQVDLQSSKFSDIIDRQGQFALDTTTTAPRVISTELNSTEQVKPSLASAKFP